MRAAERIVRDERIIRLFVAGNSYRAIAETVGLRSPQSVANIIDRELVAAARRRRLARRS
jgi:hypothetical protein